MADSTPDSIPAPIPESRIEKLLQRYKEVLTELENSPSPNEVIVEDILTTRDSVQKALEDKSQDSSEILIRIVKLDERLQRQADNICKAVKMDIWRASFDPPDSAWWWFLDQRANIWSSLLSITCLVLSLSFLGNIAPRFLTGGPELWGSTAVVLQGLFVLITGNSVFSKTAGGKLANIFPREFWAKWRIGLSLLSLAFSGLLYLSLDEIAVYYRNRGLRDFENSRLASAQSNYKRSLALDPNNGKTHFYLGSVYEEFQDFDAARTEYQIAIQSDISEAYNNMARLHIIDGKYNDAAYLLTQLEKWENADEEKPKLTEDEILGYNRRKNMGWAKLQQGLQEDDKIKKSIYLAEAIAKLEQAIDIAKEEELEQDDQTSAHCLLAKALEANGDDSTKVLEEWNYCHENNSLLNPEELIWKIEAQKRQILEIQKGISPDLIPAKPGGEL